MTPVMDILYHAWIGGPDPAKWPESLRDNPTIAHGLYSFSEGLRLGFLLATEALHPEAELH